MRSFLVVALTAVLAVALGGSLSAAGQSTHKTQAAAHTATGEIEAYDATAHTLTLKSNGGSTTFHVATDAKLWSGKQSLTLDQLASHAGAKATVTYTEKGGEKTTHTIRLTAAQKPKTAK